jgi:hypothetical protein
MLDDWSDLAFWKFFRLDRPRFRFVALSRATTSPQFQALDRNQILFGEAGMDAVGAIDCTHIQARLMSFPSSPPN